MVWPSIKNLPCLLKFEIKIKILKPAPATDCFKNMYDKWVASNSDLAGHPDISGQQFFRLPYFRPILFQVTGYPTG